MREAGVILLGRRDANVGQHNEVRARVRRRIGGALDRQAMRLEAHFFQRIRERTAGTSPVAENTAA